MLVLSQSKNLIGNFVTVEVRHFGTDKYVIVGTAASSHDFEDYRELGSFSTEEYALEVIAGIVDGMQYGIDTLYRIGAHK